MRDFTAPPRETPEAEKPEVQLVGTDGNVFALMGKCRRALRQVGQPEQARELGTRVTQASCYDEALAIMMEYVDGY